MIQSGRPGIKHEVPHSIRQYWDVRDELPVLDGVIYRGKRIVVPPTMRPAMLEITHETHLGTVKCIQRDREALHWPGMSAQIEEKVKDCSICHDHAPAQCKEPLIQSAVPDVPWSNAASDIFTFEGENYLLLVDYYSKYIEVSSVGDMASTETIRALKEHFGQHGIPSKLITDSGSQYTSKEFENFAKSYNFEHVLVSPKHPQANGEAEAAVKTVKTLWRKNKDKNKALLSYRATPIPGTDLSPSQLCKGRRLRTTLPIVQDLLKPEAYNSREIKRRMKDAKQRQKYYYDRRSAKEQPCLKPGDHVRVRPNPGSREWRAATVVQGRTSPRSYVVDTGGQRIRRNRLALRTDTEKSYIGYKRCHPNINLEQDSMALDSRPPQRIPPAQLVQAHHEIEDNRDIQQSPTRVGPTQITNETESEQVTRYGREIKRPVKLDW